MKKVTLTCVGASKGKELELIASWVYSQKSGVAYNWSG